MYLWIKFAHVALAYLTVAGFVVRVLLSLRGSDWRDAAWVRIAPHVIDTLLLAFGITLAVMLSLSPLAHGWLAGKIVGLVAYIGFGVMAMRAGSRRVKLAGFAGALISVAYVFLAAYSKQAWPF